MEDELMTKRLKRVGSWEDVVDCTRNTVHKEPLGREPSEGFKKKILIAEHSPIRLIAFNWKWKDIKSWVATHWTRHKWECYVSTQRTDRTGVNRDALPQDAPVDFCGSANTQQLIDTMRKRLCYQASLETRQYAEDLKMAITELEPEIGNVLVPNCVYRCGCPEMSSCGFWKQFSNYLTWDEMDDIPKRYERYNQWFCDQMKLRPVTEKASS